MTLGGDSFPGIDLSPPEQWAALPDAAKYQIFAAVGFLEAFSEATGTMGGEAHYTMGGVPGKYPSFKGQVPHFAPDLFDPLGLSRNKTPEQKAKGLKAEINNGRLAMLGIFGFLCEQTIPGSVPGLTGIVKPYVGDLIAGADFTL